MRNHRITKHSQLCYSTSGQGIDAKCAYLFLPHMTIKQGEEDSSTGLLKYQQPPCSQSSQPDGISSMPPWGIDMFSSSRVRTESRSINKKCKK